MYARFDRNLTSASFRRRILPLRWLRISANARQRLFPTPLGPLIGNDWSALASAERFAIRIFLRSGVLHGELIELRSPNFDDFRLRSSESALRAASQWSRQQVIRDQSLLQGTRSNLLRERGSEAQLGGFSSSISA